MYSFRAISVAALAGMMFAAADHASAADVSLATPDVLDPTPIYEQRPAVDGLNFKASALTGAVGGYMNHMFVASVASPMPFLDSFGFQIDAAAGNYRSDYTSAAAAAHIFWRDPGIGMFGIYGDWGYVNPEHGGRVGFEGAVYHNRWTLDFLVAKQFGQHLFTKIVDEVDLSYYFTDDLRGSVGHRYTSRGHVANLSFEYMPSSFGGWSVYGEAETGEDDYHGAWLGIRYSFGTGGANSLIERDRGSDLKVRIPRNIASVTQCGDLPAPKAETWWRAEMTNLCASKDELADEGAVIGKK